MKKTNKLIMLALTLIVLAVSGACNQPSGREDQAPVFQDPLLTSAYSRYIRLKDALVASDAPGAATAAAALQESLKDLPGSEKMMQSAAVISGASGLTAQREAFSTLSNALTERVKASAVKNGKVYLAFCPMAADNTGAFWLAGEKEIRNPYFGEKMLKCGEVKETFAQ